MTFYSSGVESGSQQKITTNSRPRFTRFSFNHRYRRRCIAISVIVLIYLLFKHLPAPPKTKNTSPAHLPVPDHNVDVQPHFLHKSIFREDPDQAYESRLEEALRRVELRVRREEGSSDRPSDKLWQIMLQKGSSEVEHSEDSKIFQARNSEWSYTVARDDWATDFVTNTLSSIPEIASIYNSYPSNILRADLLRYLILWYYGGYYADMDVYPARAINSCPVLQPILYPPPSTLNSEPRQDQSISLVLGIEIDEPYASHKVMRDWHWIRRYQFIQYNIYAPRRFSPLLRRVIVRILANTKRHNDASNWFLGPRYGEMKVLEITGPGAFTDAILDVLSETLPSTHPLVQTSVQADIGVGDLMRPRTPKGKNMNGNKNDQDLQTHRRVTWAPFHGLTSPLWIDATETESGREMGGLVVLPINVWGNGQRHSGSERFNSKHACINHRFGRAWKKGWWEYFFG